MGVGRSHSPAADERHNLHAIAGFEDMLGVIPSRDEFRVALDGHEPRLHIQLPDEIGQSQPL